MESAQIYLALGSSLLTAAVTLLAVFLTNRGSTQRLAVQLEHERDRAQRDIRRDKAEELYVLCRKWTTLMHITYFPFVDVMTGALDYNQALDLQISNNEKDTPDFVRLEMLVDLYFPELTTQRDALFNARDQVNKIHADHKTQYKKGDLDGRKFVEPMMNALMLVEERGDSFSEAVAMLGKRE